MHKFVIAVCCLISSYLFVSGCTQGSSPQPNTIPERTGSTKTLSAFPDQSWTVMSHGIMGWNTAALNKAKDYFMEIGSTALMVIDRGYVVVSWGDTTLPIQCNSMRKSYLSALYGIYKEKGKIHLNKTLEQLNINDHQPLSSTEKQATIMDLLKGRSGVYHPAASETKSMKKKRPLRGSHTPGSFWYYNNWDFNALGTIFEKEAGTSIFFAFYESVAVPIGMEDFTPSHGKYITVKASVHRSYKFSMSARDVARFGLLYLRNGSWNGQQVVPAKWIKQSTSVHSVKGGGIGYGLLWWVSTGKYHMGSKLTGGAFSARGYRGQYLIVAPDQKLVIVHLKKKDPGSPKVRKRDMKKLLQLLLAAKTG